jgi:hypothetical protein
MAKTGKAIGKSKGLEKFKDPEGSLFAGPGGATHQTADAAKVSLTTNQGVIVADNQNTLKSGVEGHRFWRTLPFGRRSPTSITNEFRSGLFTPVAQARTGTSR